MQLLRTFDESVPCRGGYVAIGNFDGVHRGHRRMIEELVRRARSENVPACVLTFDPHPIQLLRPEMAPPRLSTLEQKAELIASLGVDFVIVSPTDIPLLNLSPEDFFQRFIIDKLAARGLIEGPNFFFGRNRAGDVHVLRELCEASGRSLHIVEPVSLPDEQLVSSSLIRRHISDGNLGQAVAMLGHPYRLSGQVGRGSARGRELGFPTANLEAIETLLPADGVYAGVAQPNLLPGGKRPAAVHVGRNPTFGENERKVEVHLLDFAGDLYGQSLAVDLIERVRETRRFENAAELKSQLNSDLAQVRDIAGRSTWAK